MAGKPNEAYADLDDKNIALGVRWRASTADLGEVCNSDIESNMGGSEDNNPQGEKDDRRRVLNGNKGLDADYTAADLPEGNAISLALISIKGSCQTFAVNHKREIKWFWTVTTCLLVLIYLGFVFKNWNDQGRPTLKWCRDRGSLVLIVVFVIWCGFYYKFVKPVLYEGYICKNVTQETWYILYRVKGALIKVLLLLIVSSIIIFVIYDSFEYWRRLLSFCGIFIIIFCGFLTSKHPERIKWRTVVVGVTIQYCMGVFAIRWLLGRQILQCFGDTVIKFLEFSYEGARLVYGTDLVDKGVFAFQAMSVIFFMSMVIQILFYLEWMQIFCLKLGWVVQCLMGTTVCESVNAISSVFLGMTEAPFLYKPYIKDLTKSEIHAVMVGGMSTVAGTVFAAYASLGANPTYILTASIMTAPSALMFAKILYPETEKSNTDSENFVVYKSEDINIMDAAMQGAISGVGIVQGIIAGVIAAVSAVAFANTFVEWFLALAGVPDTNLETILAWILIPVVWLMGVRPEDCQQVARLIGIKTISNEFVGYAELGKLIKNHILSPRSEAIATYAMCSFSNPGSIAILASSLLTLCPEQRKNIIGVSFRAFFGAIVTSFITACVAGSLMPEEGYADVQSSSNVTLTT